jgi:hypothetical protein
MPAHERSLQITDRYRERLSALRAQAVTLTKDGWRTLDPAELDRAHAAWVQRTAVLLTELQRGGIRLSLAYLTAYLRSETGRITTPPLPTVQAGVARSGVSLEEALVPSLFTVKKAIGEGQAISAALALGLDRASRLATDETAAAARDTLAEGIREDGRIIGWRRVSGGGCGACDAAATGAIQADDETLEVHPFCSCSKEPVVAGVPDAVQRPTGEEMFHAKTEAQQDAMLGKDKADLIRSGDIDFHDLIQHDPMVAVPDGITEAPLQALKQ